ncbi:hypothetical protein [Mangrovactinospora gilvigrisea]|uniref:hypothetical protein n=1 Tax=Mangrovactinospora gilvigrisea TaxID=1428644 RepID=UPI0008FC3BC4|nr:hypothetical protein [Mangrovactinospora gilvigrisea]
MKGVTVTAHASVASLTYDMGDGTTITCHGAGTPYQASYGDKPSPTCGHTYTTSSANQPGGEYSIRATATWTVNWNSTNGLGGQFTVTPDAAVAQLRVGELQVVNE